MLFGLFGNQKIVEKKVNKKIVPVVEDVEFTKLTPPVRLKVVDTRPNWLGACRLKLGRIVKIDKVHVFDYENYYHVKGMPKDSWYKSSRFVSVK
jgi:hypothetical protein